MSMSGSDQDVPPSGVSPRKWRRWLYVPPENLIVLWLLLLFAAFMFSATGVAFAVREFPPEKVVSVVVSVTLATCVGLLTAAIAGGVAMIAAGRAIWGVAFCVCAVLAAVVAWVTVYASFGVKPVIMASFVVWLPIGVFLAAAATLLLGHFASWLVGNAGRTVLGVVAAWLGLDGASHEPRWGRLVTLLLAAYLLTESGLAMLLLGAK